MIWTLDNDPPVKAEVRNGSAEFEEIKINKLNLVQAQFYYNILKTVIKELAEPPQDKVD